MPPALKCLYAEPPIVREKYMRRQECRGEGRARGDLRKAWHCAGSLFHLHDWVYAAHTKAIKTKFTFTNKKRTQRVSKASQFANAIGETYPDFQLVRGIANASKHFALRKPPPGRKNPPGVPSHAANTYVISGGFQSSGFRGFQTDKVVLQAAGGDIEFSHIAQSVYDMWNILFVAEGW